MGKTKALSATSRKRIAIPKEKLAELAKHEWVIYTTDSVTGNAVSEYLSDKGCGTIATKEINHNGTLIKGFLVNFEVVEWLRKNRTQYKYRSYHKNPKNKKWFEWREGKQSPTEYTRMAFSNPIPWKNKNLENQIKK